MVMAMYEPGPSLGTLPEELHILILQHLDQPPPTESQFWGEPTLDCGKHPAGSKAYKNLSLVSKSWRRLTMPFLFSNLRIYLDLGRVRLRMKNGRQDAYAECIGQALDTVKDLTSRAGSAPKVNSVTIIADSLINDGYDESGNPSVDREVIARHSSIFWHAIFGLFNPSVVNVVASPHDMILLANLQARSDPDSFLPSDLSTLQLRQDRSATSIRSSSTTHDSKQKRRTAGSLLDIVPWTHVGVNDGSDFGVKARESDPQSMTVFSEILRAVRKHNTPSIFSMNSENPLAFPRHLRSFAYSINDPVFGRLNLRPILELVEHLELQLAGGLQEKLADDELADDTEYFQSIYGGACNAYAELARLLQTVQIPFQTQEGKMDFRSTVHDECIKVRRLVVRDVHSAVIGGTLDFFFTNLCLPVWAEYERGVFTRLIDLPNELESKS